MSRRVLYLEPIGGIAGDMFMALAIDLGVAPEAIERALAGLPLPPWRLQVTRAVRHAIGGTHVDVVVDEAAAHGHHTALREIRGMIDGCATMSAEAKARAQRIFTVIGEAEAKIHGVGVDEVHFHEVGAVDSIVDVCAAAVVLELLGNPTLLSAPPPMGSGTVGTAHGPMPVPPPATLEILRDVTVRFEGVGELTTPTGAGILKALAHVGPAPELRVEKVGYGVGTKDLPDRANVLRGTLATAEAGAEQGVWIIEANIDDASPQLLGALIERLLEAGALDAFVVPAVMKKSRPGHLFTVVAPSDRRDPLIDLLLRESTTIGVRYHRTERLALERRFETVATAFGEVRIKLALKEGAVINAQPEFEDCRARARERNVPVKEVIAEALAVWRRR
ncbi:MAG: nickel pincer cofactor biosynthesis protein LarC [Myxococcaceae bacterium]|nr:nickel pincer cofactor biosynthesis protein LarC [Myxococcaceae bacterium]